MKYIIYNETFDVAEKNGFIFNLMRRLLPKCNTNMEDKIKYVLEWWLEIDDKNGKIIREIGFNKNKEVIIIGPWDNNYGFWTDSNVLIEKYAEYKAICENEFKEKWDNYINESK